MGELFAHPRQMTAGDVAGFVREHADVVHQPRGIDCSDSGLRVRRRTAGS